jgi:hypothetical protein
MAVSNRRSSSRDGRYAITILATSQVSPPALTHADKIEHKGGTVSGIVCSMVVEASGVEA